MRALRLATEAQHEIEQITTYYNQQQWGLGSDFVADLRRTVRQIQEFPGMAVSLKLNARRARLHRFPYGVVYQVEPTEIMVYAVMHLHRDPEYWIDRLP